VKIILASLAFATFMASPRLPGHKPPKDQPIQGLIRSKKSNRALTTKILTGVRTRPISQR
jgi:hypothetical protein